MIMQPEHFTDNRTRRRCLRASCLAVWATVALTAMPAGTALSSDAHLSAPPPAEIRAVEGRGDWKSARQAVGPASQAWRLSVTRGQDGALYGRIEVDEAPLFRAGNVAGSVEGETVRGTITADDGTYLARFEGEVDGSWMRGSYTTADGDRGTWVWPEPAARAVVEAETAAAK